MNGPGAELARAARATLGDAVITPDKAGYEPARTIWNARLARRPAAIVRCRSAAQVAAAIGVARAAGAPLAVRSGGHDYAGHSSCEGGLVIDLSALDGIAVDAPGRRVRVGPGVTWGRLDAATQRFALAATGGTVSSVGVAGFTLGGGTGWLTRRFGMGLDNLVAAEVVLASGDIVRADAEEHPDLFWALRGGGGNFGIVTSFELRLHEVGPAVVGGQLVYPFAAARRGLEVLREAMAQAPEPLQCYPFLYTVPPMAPFPQELHGRTALALVTAWTGDPERAERALAPLRAAGPPALDTVAPLDYTALQQSFDAGLPKGLRWSSRGHYLDALSDAAIDTVLAHTEHMPGPFTAVYFEPQGGAAARVEPRATAFPHRRAAFGFHVLAGWQEAADDAANLEWLRSFDRAMAPHVTGGVYVNLLAEDEPERVAAAYGANFARLRELKRRYDPDNLLRSNRNIPPAD